MTVRELIEALSVVDPGITVHVDPNDTASRHVIRVVADRFNAFLLTED